MLEQIIEYYNMGVYHPQQTGWVIPLIAALAAIGGTLASNRSAKKRQQESLAQNMLLQQQEFDQNKEMWELQNKYNDPSAQMSRLQAAGLNPNLVYGSGGATTESAPAPKYEAPVADFRAPIQIPDMLGMYQDFQMKQAQINNVKAQTEATHSEIMSKAIERELAGIRGKTMSFDLDRRRYLAPYQAAITGNEARASEARLQQEWQKLKLMGRDEQIKMLVEQQKTSQLKGQDIQNDLKAAELLFSKYRNQWMKEGITTADHPLLRIFVRMMAESGLSEYNPFHSKSK